MYSEFSYFGLNNLDQFLAHDAKPTSLSDAVGIAMASEDGALEVRATARIRPEGHGSGVDYRKRFSRGNLEDKTLEQINELIRVDYDAFVESWRAS